MVDKPKFSILFISEDPENRYELKSLLSEQGYDIQVTESRVRAFQLLDLSNIGLFIIGAEVPKSNANSFCQALRSDKKYQSLPVVIIGEDEEDGSNCIAAFKSGADDFIQYPFVDGVCTARIQRFAGKTLGGGAASFLSVHVSAGELPGVLQYLEADIKTGKLNIKREDDAIGVLYFRDGKLVNATAPFCEEMEAITEVLSWDSSHVTFEEGAIAEEDVKFDQEATGTVMTCIVGVDEYREFKKGLPSNEMMYHAGPKAAEDEMEIGKKGIYDLAITGYSTDDLLKSQKFGIRRSTLWLHGLIEENYLKVSPPPFENHAFDAYQTYKKIHGLSTRVQRLREGFSRVSFPLREEDPSWQVGASDMEDLVPKIVLVGDKFEHLTLFAESIASIASSLSQMKPLVKKHRKGVVTTRIFLSEDDIIDLQQLPPTFDKLIVNSLSDYLTELAAVIYVVSAHDKKTNEENSRRMRILRQRFRGVYFFTVPQIPNDKGICEFRMDCTDCGYRLAVDMEMAGSIGECPICKASLTIPDCLDHLAHSLKVPDAIPIVQIRPQEQEYCRDLLLILFDSILNACNPPVVPVQGKPVESVPHAPEGSSVRERESKASLNIHVDDEAEAPPPEPAPPDVDAPPASPSRPVQREVITDTEFNAIIDEDEDHFDIDEFIKSVGGDD